MVISCNFNELHISGQDQQIPIYFNIDNNPLLRQCMLKECECGHSKKQGFRHRNFVLLIQPVLSLPYQDQSAPGRCEVSHPTCENLQSFWSSPICSFSADENVWRFHNCYRFNINVTCIWHISCQARVVSSYPARKSVEALADSSLTREPYHQNCQRFAPLHHVVSGVPTASICSWNHVAPWTCDFWKRDLEKNQGASGRWTKFTMCLNMSLYLMNTTELSVLVLATSFIRTYTPPWHLPIHHDISYASGIGHLFQYHPLGLSWVRNSTHFIPISKHMTSLKVLYLYLTLGFALHNSYILSYLRIIQKSP